MSRLTFTWDQMTEFRLQPLVVMIAPERDNPQQVEGVLNRPPPEVLMASSIFFRSPSRMEITRALALRVFGAMKPGIRRSWKGLASLLNRKPTMSADPAAILFLLNSRNAA
jgi:hypothetical protein